jgi:hypothetical protein
LSTPNEPHTLLHERADVKPVHIPNIICDDATRSTLLDAQKHFVDHVGRVHLEHEHLLHLMQHRLGFAEVGATIESFVDTPWAKLEDPLVNLGVHAAVDRFDTEHFLSEFEPVRDFVNAYDTLGPPVRKTDYLPTFGCENGDAFVYSLQLSPPHHAYPNRAEPPNGNCIAFFDARIEHAVVAGGNNVAEIQRLFVRDFVGNWQEVDVAVWDADVFGLSACESAREMRISEDSGVAMPVHRLHETKRKKKT